MIALSHARHDCTRVSQHRACGIATCLLWHDTSRLKGSFALTVLFVERQSPRHVMQRACPYSFVPNRDENTNVCVCVFFLFFFYIASTSSPQFRAAMSKRCTFQLNSCEQQSVNCEFALIESISSSDASRLQCPVERINSVLFNLLLCTKCVAHSV